MASIPPENTPTYFGFNDLHGFKDFLVYVYSYAPDLFSAEEWRKSDQQMNPDRAFLGLQYGLDLTAKEKDESKLLTECRRLVGAAHQDYQSGNDQAGQLKLEEVEKLLKRKF